MGNEKYQNIINMEHHVSPTRPHMSRLDRAAQFAPFAALVGYDDAIDETARLTDRKLILVQEQIDRIDEKIQYLRDHPENNSAVTVVYFVPDQRKQGGTYLRITGTVKKIDSIEKCIIMQNGSKIPMEDIYHIKIQQN
jgi:hypothetical protein